MPSDLLAFADRRWAQVRAEQPALGPAIDLQVRLLSRQIGLLDAATERVASSPAGGTDCSGGLIQAGRTAFGAVPEDPASAGIGVVSERAFADALADLGATSGRQAAGRIRASLATGRLELPTLLRAALHRRQGEARDIAAPLGLNLPVLWFAAELSVAPLAHAWQRRLLGLTPADDRLRDLVAAWDRGTCPACGSWPALAEFFHGARLNRCAFCSAFWPLAHDRCTFCDTADERFRTVVPDAARPGRRLELCRACGGYVKTIDVGQLTPFPLVAVEDLASSDLDRAALHHGFRRTPLRE
jgi:FdhE protein